VIRNSFDETELENLFICETIIILQVGFVWLIRSKTRIDKTSVVKAEMRRGATTPKIDAARGADA